MSIYRIWRRVPSSDVHQAGEHVAGPKRAELVVTLDDPQPVDWTSVRKAGPANFLFPALAALWPRPDAFEDCIDELLVDRRRGRKGFPIEVVTELYALEAYHAMLQADQNTSKK